MGGNQGPYGADRPAPSPLAYPSQLTSLLEREGIVALTTRLLEDARAGRGGCLFIVGEAGLGKTAALRAVVDHAVGQFRIALGRGDAMEQLIPYGMLSQAIDQLGGSGVLGLSGTGMAPTDARATRFFGFLRWLESHADAPTMLGLDDLHWADPDSLGLLSFVTRRIKPLPVALIATLRPWPAAAYTIAADLAHDGHAEMTTLAPLSEEASGHLLTALVGQAIPDDVVSQAWEFCSGNPLLLEQVATILSSGDFVGDVTKWGSRRADEKLLLSRFAGLPPEGISLIRAASVLGIRFRCHVASEMAGLGEGEAAVALEALHRSRLVRSVGGSWLEFVHPLFHQALYEDVGPAVQTRLHARAFKLLHARGLDDEAAEHAVRAELVGDAEAVAVLEASGRAALATGALGVATKRLGMAVELAGPRASAELLTALGQALLVHGRPTESIAVWERLLARDDLSLATRVQALRSEGLAYASMARHERASASYDEATRLAEESSPGLAAEVLVDHALVSWLSGGPARSVPLALRAKKLAEGDAGRVRARADAAWGFTAWMSGDPDGLDATAAAAAPLVADPLSDVADLCSGVTSTLAMYAMATAFAEQFEASDRAASAALAAAEKIGAAQTTVWFSISHSYTLYRMGRLPRSLALAQRAEELSEFFPMAEPYLACAQARLELNAGRVQDAMAWCTKAEERAHLRGEWLALLFTWDCLGQIFLRKGDPGSASELYRRVEVATERIGLLEPCFVPWGRNAVSSHLGCGRVGDARRVLALLERCVDRLPCLWPRIVIETGRAGLAEREGRRNAAKAHFASALHLHERLALPLEHVETLLDYGAFLRRSGEPVHARRCLKDALQLAEALGSVWLTALISEELKVAGGRRRGRRFNELTPQEERVARAAASGRPNAELAQLLSVSVNTIETHLRHIYAKLGIRSRSELAAHLASLARPDDS